MSEAERPALSMTLRGVPTDVVLAVKRCVMEHNAAHPDQRVTQTDVVTWAVRAWVQNGGGISPAATNE
jgi:hypothetical protein